MDVEQIDGAYQYVSPELFSDWYKWKINQPDEREPEQEHLMEFMTDSDVLKSLNFLNCKLDLLNVKSYGDIALLLTDILALLAAWKGRMRSTAARKEGDSRGKTSGLSVSDENDRLEKTLRANERRMLSTELYIHQALHCKPVSVKKLTAHFKARRSLVCSLEMRAFGKLLPCALPPELLELIWKETQSLNEKEGFVMRGLCMEEEDGDRMVVEEERLTSYFNALYPLHSHLLKILFSSDKKRYSFASASYLQDTTEESKALVAAVRQAEFCLDQHVIPDSINGAFAGSNQVCAARNGHVSTLVRKVLLPFRELNKQPETDVRVRWSSLDPTLVPFLFKYDTFVAVVVWDLVKSSRIVTATFWKDLVEKHFLSEIRLGDKVEIILKSNRLILLIKNKLMGEIVEVMMVNWQFNNSWNDVMLNTTDSNTKFIRVGEKFSEERKMEDISFDIATKQGQDVLSVAYFIEGACKVEEYSVETGESILSFKLVPPAEHATKWESTSHLSLARKGSFAIVAHDQPSEFTLYMVDPTLRIQEAKKTIHCRKDRHARAVCAFFDKDPQSSLVLLFFKPRFTQHVYAVLHDLSGETGVEEDNANEDGEHWKLTEEARREREEEEWQFKEQDEEVEDRDDGAVWIREGSLDSLIFYKGVIFYLTDLHRDAIVLRVRDVIWRSKRSFAACSLVSVSNNKPMADLPLSRCKADHFRPWGYPASSTDSQVYQYSGRKYGEWRVNDGRNKSTHDCAETPHSLIVPGLAFTSFRKDFISVSRQLNVSRNWGFYHEHLTLHLVNDRLVSLVGQGNLVEISFGLAAQREEAKQLRTLRETAATWRAHWDNLAPLASALSSEQRQRLRRRGWSDEFTDDGYEYDQRYYDDDLT